MTDTTNIRDAIKGLPDDAVICAFCSTCVGHNTIIDFATEDEVICPTCGGKVPNDFDANDLKALVAENARLRKTLGTAQKAAKLFADTLPPKGGQAIARDLLETINETLATHGGNDD